MKILVDLYDAILEKARHKNAKKYLAAVSFTEASFFPIPPDVMLIPMVVAKPEKAFSLAFITTVFSVLGGMLGYTIGYLLFEPVVMPTLNYFGYVESYNIVNNWFTEWGFWAVFLAGFTFIPFKLFTICAGMMKFSILPFVVAAIFGRGGRFFLVAFILKLGGKKLENKIREITEKLGWLILVLFLGCASLYKLYY